VDVLAPRLRPAARGRLQPFILAETDAPGVIYRRAAEVEIAGPSPLPVQADGEFLGYTPLKLRAVPGALSVLVPDEPNPLFGEE
jgi:diacylglycerol kinase family enzyme